MLLTDVQNHWIGTMLPSNLLRKLGKGAGEFAATLAFAAISYYVLREAFVAAMRRKLALPAELASILKLLVSVLRLVHPFLGVLVLVIVLFHGYVLWLIWSAGNFNMSVSSGLLAFSVLTIAAVSGLCIRLLPKLLKFRYVHRIAGILFILAFSLHKMFE